MDSTCDVDWNNKYNMVVICGFGDSYPLLMYAYEKSQKEIYFSLGRNLVDEDVLLDESLMSTPRKRKKSMNRSAMTKSRKSLTDTKTDFDQSFYSDKDSTSRIGRPDYESDYNIYQTPEKK
jgi:hypothetical protein